MSSGGWGIGLQKTISRLELFTSFDPESRHDDLFSAFLQDEITIIEDLLKLTLGTKFEDNDYTGVEVQPSARVSWTPTEKSTWWAAVSRAVRTPSRAEEDVRIVSMTVPPGAGGPGSPLSSVTLLGDADFDSEELVAYELGYRVTPTDSLSVDIAAFFNDYENLRTLEPAIPFPSTDPVPHLLIPFSAGNEMAGQTYGVEVAADLQVLEWWQLRGSYSYLHIDLDPSAFSLDSTAKTPEGESPHNQVYLRSLMNLSMNVEFDAMFRYVDNLASIGVPGYTSLDLRLGWRPHEDVEISIVGQNLLDEQHEEFAASFLDTTPTEQERSVYGKVTVNF